MKAELLVLYSGGYDARLDGEIERLIGAPAVGGGFGMCDGLRDLEFRFASEAQARWVGEKVARFSSRIAIVSVRAVA